MSLFLAAPTNFDEIEEGFAAIQTAFNQASAQSTQGFNQAGLWTTVGHNGGLYTASGTQTWTVEAGDQKVYVYSRLGNTVFLNVDIQNSSVGGGADTGLRITLPNNWRAKRNAVTVAFFSDTGAAGAIKAFINANETYYTFYRSANWTGTTDGTNVAFTGVVEIIP